MISRRMLLLGGAGGLFGLAGLRLGLVTPESAVAIIIRRQLAYLKIDDADVERFARDYTAAGRTSRNKLRLVAAVEPLFRLLPVGGAGPASVRYGEERVVTEFLLSSDFFVNGGDVALPVRYLGVHEPWKPGNVCRHPFAIRTVST